MNIHCIHHDDLDGRCSAAIVAYVYGKTFRWAVNFIEANYDTILNFDGIQNNDVVYIVDFSLQEDMMKSLMEKTKRIVWIDHHDTAKNYSYYYLDGLRDFGEKSSAACELTWRFFFPDEDLPIPVMLIGDYDKWALLHAPKCFEFYEGMKMIDHSPTAPIWGVAFSSINPEYFNTITDMGKTAIKYRDEYCKDMTIRFGYEVEIAGIKGFATNLIGFGSGAFANKMDEYDFCASYVHNGKFFKFSLYSKKVDVSEICKKYGGGGHTGAAGFSSETLPWKIIETTK